MWSSASGGLPGPSPAVKRGEHSNKGDGPADIKHGIQTSEAVRSELGEPSYQASDAPVRMGIAQSSQSLDALRGSDPVDLGSEKPDGQSTASGSGLCAPVNSPARFHVNVGSSLTAQSGAALRGSEAEDLVPEKPDGQSLDDAVRMGSVPSVQHRDAACTTEAGGAVSSGEAEHSCEPTHGAPERVWARLVKADESCSPAEPIEQPSRPDELNASHRAQPCVPRSGHAVTSCLEPLEELEHTAFHTGVARDTSPTCPGVSEASSSSMPAKDGEPHGVVPDLVGRSVPSVYVARQHDHLREEGSSTPSSSDAETVGVPYPDIQLDFNMSHDARGKPAPATCSPRTNDSGVEAKTAVSNAGRTSPSSKAFHFVVMSRPQSRLPTRSSRSLLVPAVRHPFARPKPVGSTQSALHTKVQLCRGLPFKVCPLAPCVTRSDQGQGGFSWGQQVSLMCA